MIIIPEIQAVVILVPRTGTGTLRRIIADRYPKSMLVYRHMEADGIPIGYDHWKKVGVVRNPVDRLWSLYKFLRGFGGDYDPAYIEAMRSSVRMSFCEWIVNNEVVFTSPHDRAGKGRFFPQFTVRHPLPENRKSQWMYLRPDFGTIIYNYKNLHDLYQDLDVDAGALRHNQTSRDRTPELCEAAADHVQRFFAWDFEASEVGKSKRMEGNE